MVWAVAQIYYQDLCSSNEQQADIPHFRELTKNFIQTISSGNLSDAKENRALA